MTRAGFGYTGRLPVILQSEKSECALACLAMVLACYGHRIDLNTLRNRYPQSQHGISLKSLVSLAGRLNLSARPVRLEVEDIGKLSLPAVLHWDLDHFVVLQKMKRRCLVIHDPAAGRRQVSMKDAGKHFTGVALELLPMVGFLQKNEQHKLKLWDLLYNGASMLSGLFQLLVLSLLLQLFAIAMPFYTQVLLDDVLVNHDVDLLKLLAAGFLLVVLFRQLTELVRAHVVMHLGNRVSLQFATRLCCHLLHLPLEYFSRRHIGDVVSRFNSLNNVRDFLCSGIVEIVIDGLMVSGTLALMFFYSTSLTCIALAGVVFYGLVRLGTYQSLQGRNEEWINDLANENTLFMENVSVIQGIKLAGREASRMASWLNRYVSVINSGIRVQKLGITIHFANGLLLGSENILLLLAGSIAVLEGALTIGMLMAFVSFKDHFYRSMFSLLDKLFEFKVLDVHLCRLADIAFCRPEMQTRLPSSLEPAKAVAPVITIDNVGYRYHPDSPWLFRNVSLQPGPQEIVALIGPTGCGKSTLLKIASSLIMPVEGRLLLDGDPVTRKGLENYRRVVSGVMQGDTLLSGSIVDNITFFDTTPDLERAHEAARLAAMDTDIARLPMHYHTMVGNMGVALSGGQVQRLLLARAIYQQPAMLLLDEATSHLDLTTEEIVNCSLRELAIPCLMVAHRPQTVLKADRIFFLGLDGLLPVSHDKFRQLLQNSGRDDGITL